MEDNSGSNIGNFNISLPLISDDNSVDDLMNISTQQLVFKREENVSDRFGPKITENELEKQRLLRIPKKTLQNNKFAMNVWRSWAFNRNSSQNSSLEEFSVVPIEIASITEVELDFWLCRFVNEARRQDGSKYPPNTLYNITCGIQRYLKEECKRPEVNFFNENNVRFSDFRRTLDSVMKSLTTEGLGVVKHTKNLSVDEEMKLWETGVINKTTAKGLSYGVFFYNCKMFGFRGLTEHREVQVQQYTFHHAANGNLILEFQEHYSKNVQGGFNNRKHEPKQIVQYADPGNPRCVVDLFQKYLTYIPSAGAFYRRPLVSKDGVKFSSQVIGVNTLGKYMQLMFDEAKIENKVVNHSGRVYCCSTLYNSGFEEQEVMSRSGHRSVAVRNYKRPSESKLQEISNALQPPAPKLHQPASTASQNEIDCSDGTAVTNDSSGNDRVLRLEVPSCINTVIVVKEGKEIKITL